MKRLLLSFAFIAFANLLQGDTIHVNDRYWYMGMAGRNGSLQYVSVKGIDSKGFGSASQITVGELNIPSSFYYSDMRHEVRIIGSGAFSNYIYVTSVYIPSTVKEIESSAFSGCTSLTKVTNSANITSLPSSVFSGCTSLEVVNIPTTVTTIGSSAFSNCTSLSSITIPNKVSGINSNAFNGCSNLKSVIFKGEPATTVGSSAFPKTNGYYSIAYADSWESVIDENGMWNNLKMTPLYTVNVEIVGNGSIEGDGEHAAGNEIILTAIPEDGNLFCGWGTSPIITSNINTFVMPAESISLVAYFAPTTAVSTYVSGRHLTTKEEAKQALLDADEVFTADEMKMLALGSPVIEVKEGKAKVGITLNKAATLNGEWQKVKDIEVEVIPDENEDAAFYRFVVPER